MENLDRFKPFFLGDITEVTDKYCDDPIMWGYYLKRSMPSELFNELRSFSQMEYIDSEESWFLVIQALTREEAILKYGQITEEIFGPRGEDGSR
ncbi:MAG: hypothetical protein NVV82_00535 [Sporocytophaga sp.]|nr:hypothetical protein [Sporocytophaga sp.]